MGLAAGFFKASGGIVSLYAVGGLGGVGAMKRRLPLPVLPCLLRDRGHSLQGNTGSGSLT